MHKLFILLVCMINIAPVFSQTSHTVKGRVVDGATGETLAGAHVYSSTNDQQGTYTDAEGYFELAIPFEDWLAVTFVGYETQTLLPYTTDSLLYIRLTPDIDNIQEVIIEAPSLAAEEFAVKKISRLDIYTNPSAKADPLLAVGAMPFATTLDESANISLRGSSPAATGIFLDNVPMYDAVRFSQLNGIGTFSIFNTSLIKQVEVFPGNPPLEFGNTSAGVIALTTSDNIPEKTSGSLALSLANVGLQAIAPVHRKAAFTVFSNYQPSGIIKALNTDALADISSFTSVDAGVQYKQQLGKSMLKVFNYTLREGYHFNFQHPSYQGDFAQQKFRNFTLTNFTKNFDHSILAFNQGFSISRAQYATGNMDAKIANHNFYFSGSFMQFYQKLTLKSGVSLDTRRSQTDGCFPLYAYAMRPTHPTVTAKNATQLHLPEIYTYGKYDFSKRWQAGLGIRKNIPTQDQNSFLSYQFNTRFNINSKQSFRLSSGVYHQYLLPDEEDGLVFIKSKQVSIDYLYRTAKLELTASVFGKDERYNAVKRQVYGLETSADVQWNPKFRTQLSYTYLQNNQKAETLQYHTPYDLDYFIRAGLSYAPFPFWTCTVAGLFRQGTLHQTVSESLWQDDLQVFRPVYTSAAEAYRLPGYRKIDISVSRMWQLSDKLHAISFLNINNLMNWENVRDMHYNADYSVVTAQLLSLRVIYFGVVINFQ